MKTVTHGSTCEKHQGPAPCLQACAPPHQRTCTEESCIIKVCSQNTHEDDPAPAAPNTIIRADGQRGRISYRSGGEEEANPVLPRDDVERLAS